MSFMDNIIKKPLTDSTTDLTNGHHEQLHDLERTSHAWST